MKKMLIAAASSGAGKTTITLGLMQLLMNQGFVVQPYKVGPDYVDTEYHSRITGRSSRNLDMFLIRDEARLAELFQRQAATADICVIEGVMGLFDGFGVDKDYCSSSGIAKQLNCPVILVVDGQSASTSVAAVVKGFLDFDEELTIAGVIINKVASENHYQLIKKAIEKYTKAEVLGYLPRNLGIQLPSRQLGLVPDREIADVLAKVQQVADLLKKTVNLEKLLALLAEEEVPKKVGNFPNYAGLKVAYALDEAFHFYYPDNLQLLQDYGVELQPFSPINDESLPPADLYYFGGGYPEEFAKELAANQKMLTAIKAQHKAGAYILAECGGLMYLGESLKVNEETFSMVGIFQGESQMTTGLKRFGYCYGIPQQNTLIGRTGEKIYGHEFHHSIFETDDPPVLLMEKFRDGQVVNQWQGGYQKKNTFASYLHLHFYQRPTFLIDLLNQVKESREK
ncbi:cobyrinic acid a,c-diamide synthase [Enterococcus sp. PF1-24]|uniref:cobyrinate a,c-diamide synthase n=1 Tax=unclassified Enterococcus TaxID=2608891 RepID=UPI002476C7B7|nr:MULTISPECIES: cobyrinate a,c-diamide synthase [unclassified Enterococcus]MDH6363389.1 cobyrinic acid a,c-diamide synthase [Enterococcus sp. PFB1-1]MDH6400310.1 cobyrinic acid a,c-diamide synthase [Enterococcus sp. PF1-24]